jgi:type I restriction enzyme S subunit
MTQVHHQIYADKRIKDFCQVGDGAHASIARQDHGVMYLSAKNFKSSGLDLISVEYISEGDYEKHFGRTKKSVTTPVKGDVLFGIIGSLGTPYTVKNSDRFGLSSSVAILRPNKALCPEYLYYFMTSKAFQSAIHAIKSGVAQGFLSLEMIKNLPLFTHEINIQRKIAAILSGYDDLIEKNQRRIALLEKIAEEIYREWFVRMRFPGHEKVKIVKGVPIGWEQKFLPEFANITYGYAFDGSRFNAEGQGKPIIRIRNIPKSETTDYTDEVANDKYIVRHGDLLVGMDGEFHINHWQGEEAYLVQRVCKIVAKNPALQSYISHAVRAPIKHFESILMGATVGHLGAMHLKNITLLIPPVHIQDRLHALSDLHQQMLSLSKVTKNLSRTRDALLPRLISGKLSVEHLDIKFPPSMEEVA